MLSIFTPKFWIYVYHYVRGINNLSNHDYEKAIEAFNKALVFCPKNNLKLLGILYEELGICYTDLNNIDKGEFFLLKSLEMHSLKNQKKLLTAEVASRLGFIYKENGQLDKSKYYLEEALKRRGRKISFTNWELVDQYLKELASR